MSSASIEEHRGKATDNASRILIHCVGSSPADFDESAVAGELFWEGQKSTTVHDDARITDPASTESLESAAMPPFRAVRAKSVHACCAQGAATEQLSELRLQLGESHAAEAKAAAAATKLKHERDAQRIQTKRLAQEKNQLLAELRTLQQQSAQVRSPSLQGLELECDTFVSLFSALKYEIISCLFKIGEKYIFETVTLGNPVLGPSALGPLTTEIGHY